MSDRARALTLAELVRLSASAREPQQLYAAGLLIAAFLVRELISDGRSERRAAQSIRLSSVTFKQ